jgi:hypothetical protein
MLSPTMHVAQVEVASGTCEERNQHFVLIERSMNMPGSGSNRSRCRACQVANLRTRRRGSHACSSPTPAGFAPDQTPRPPLSRLRRTAPRKLRRCSRAAGRHRATSVDACDADRQIPRPVSITGHAVAVEPFQTSLCVTGTVQTDSRAWLSSVMPTER